jgi:tRNA G18 (ribose-2'-O)-methylase SpoU
MRSWDFTEKKFLSLKKSLQHKKASQLLKELFLANCPQSLVSCYRDMEKWLSLPETDLKDQKAVTDRFHFHLQEAGLCLKEHFLLHVERADQESSTAFLPVYVFLPSLRSAFNVGSILRTMEAFRLGTVCFSGYTPTPQNPKVQKASMNTFDKVPCKLDCQLKDLPRPWIALETALPSIALSDFSFPKTFTLILGNEELGIPKQILVECDAILRIPLVGSKNSLNVASAFAIAAAAIRSQMG